mgnify:CR=1 FL=1
MNMGKKKQKQLNTSGLKETMVLQDFIPIGMNIIDFVDMQEENNQ